MSARRAVAHESAQLRSQAHPTSPLNSPGRAKAGGGNLAAPGKPVRHRWPKYAPRHRPGAHRVPAREPTARDPPRPRRGPARGSPTRRREIHGRRQGVHHPDRLDTVDTVASKAVAGNGCGHLVWPRLRSLSSWMLAPRWRVRLLVGGLACRRECWPHPRFGFSRQVFLRRGGRSGAVTSGAV